MLIGLGLLQQINKLMCYLLFHSESTLLSASIDGGTMTVSNLTPTSCKNATYSAKSTVTLNYTNQLSTTAFISGKLTVNNFTKPHDSTSGTELASGNFAALYNKTTATIMTNATLKKNNTSGTTNGTQTMHLYVWLDKDYEYTNAGSGVVNNPMDDLSFTITLSCSINNTPANQPA